MKHEVEVDFGELTDPTLMGLGDNFETVRADGYLVSWQHRSSSGRCVSGSHVSVQVKQDGDGEPQCFPPPTGLGLGFLHVDDDSLNTLVLVFLM